MATVVVGAVAHSPNAVAVWEGIREHFQASEVETDYVLFSSYERQVEALLRGQIDVAWNTGLAWVRAVGMTGGRCRALAMRDTDLGCRTVFVGSGGRSPTYLRQLQGRRLALGARDSARAAILPLHFLDRMGLALDKVELVRFDGDLGKHGETGRGEVEAVRAVRAGRADAAAIGLVMWHELALADMFPLWRSPPYCHRNFTALDSLDAGLADAWTRHLMAMDWDDPGHRPILEMEGLRRWVQPELDGYRALFEAVERQAAALR
jgi:ABC-type phosphate/phosphonate transport system substrate-binding protein